MGDLADMAMSGEMCQQCGAYMGGGGYGFPRSCGGCITDEEREMLGVQPDKPRAPRPLSPDHPVGFFDVSGTKHQLVVVGGDLHIKCKGKAEPLVISQQEVDRIMSYIHRFAMSGRLNRIQDGH